MVRVVVIQVRAGVFLVMATVMFLVAAVMAIMVAMVDPGDQAGGADEDVFALFPVVFQGVVLVHIDGLVFVVALGVFDDAFPLGVIDIVGSVF